MNRYLVPLAVLFFIGCSNPSQTNEAPVESDTALSEPVAAPLVNEVNESTVVPVAQEEPAPAPQTQVVAPEPKKVEPVQKAPQPVKAEKAVATAPKEPIKKVAEVPKQAGVDGSLLFAQKCASCHGIKAEKPALGKSQVIAGWSAQQVEDALNGYRSGSYGKEMKAIMQGQAKGLSADQQSAVAKFISTL